MESPLCDFLLLESLVLKPALKDYILSVISATANAEHERKIKPIFEQIESILFSQLFSGSVNAAIVILWSDLFPLFYDGNRIAFCRRMNAIPEFQMAWKLLVDNFDPKVQKNILSMLSLPKNDEFNFNKKPETQGNFPKLKTNMTNKKNVSKQDNSELLNSNSKLTSDQHEETIVNITDVDKKNAAGAFKCLHEIKVPVYPKPKKPLPKSIGVRNILITSALPYVNNVPHLGNLVGSTLSANVFARYCDLVGHNVLSICGTDEYGTATEAKAVAEKLTPREICDKVVQAFFKRLWKRGFISSDTVDQLFCEQCSKFLADRFIEGICPFCNYTDARGDQCDKCGRLMNALELIKARCKICQSVPVKRSSKHLFLDLPKIEQRLAAFIQDRVNDPTCLWSANACTISNSWIRDGVKPRCITRDLKWGVPVPLEEYANKVFYVWFDAPLGYLSITANYTNDWEQWWCPSDDLDNGDIELYQFMAKDNVPFHAIIFPSCLLAADMGHTLVKHLLSTEYMNYESTKFSKSRGIGVFGDDAMNSGIIADVWRFYLLYRRPETHDSAFLWDDFMLVNNSELLNNLGNFIHRALSFVARFFNSVVPDISKLESNDIEFLAKINKLCKDYIDSLESCRLRDGIQIILHIARLGNAYFQVNQPWVTFKKEDTRARSGVVLGVAANVVSLLGMLIHPYMPTIGREIWSTQCNLNFDQFTLLCFIKNNCRLPQLLIAGHKIGKPTTLFRKIEVEEISHLSKKYRGKE